MAAFLQCPCLLCLIFLLRSHGAPSQLAAKQRNRTLIVGSLSSNMSSASVFPCEERLQLDSMADECLKVGQGLCVSRIGSESVDATDPVACCCPFKMFGGVLSIENAVLDAPEGMCRCGSSSSFEKSRADESVMAAFNAGWTYDVLTEWKLKDLTGVNEMHDDFEIYDGKGEIAMTGHATRGYLKVFDKWDIHTAAGELLMVIVEKGESAVYKHYEIIDPLGNIIATIRVSALAVGTELYMYTGDPVFDWRNRPVTEDTKVLMTIASPSVLSSSDRVEVYEGDYGAKSVTVDEDEGTWKWTTNLGGHNLYNIQVAPGRSVKLLLAGMIVFDEVVEDMTVCVIQ